MVHEDRFEARGAKRTPSGVDWSLRARMVDSARGRGTSMTSDFAEAFAQICDELKVRISQKVHAAGVRVPEEDLARLQNVIVWMTIDPELQEMLLVTALDPVDWARLEPDLPKITQVFREELAVARAALRRLKEETVTRRRAEERRDPPES
jgi:hypothetical protein